MRFSDLLGTGLASLRQRPFRTLLTVLGVVIGTAAVVVMVSLGIGMTQGYTQSVEENPGLRQVRIYSVPQDAVQMGLPTAVNQELVTYLASYPGVEAAWPTYNVEAMATVDGHTTYLSVTGVPHEAIVSRNIDFEWGDFPQQGSLGLVLGDQIGLSLFYDEITGMPIEVDFQTSTLFLQFGAMPEGPGFPGEAPPEETPKPKKLIMPIAGVRAHDEANPYGMDSFAIFAELDPLVDTLKKAMPGKPLPNQPSTADGKPMPGFVYSEIVLETTDPGAAEALMTSLRSEGWDAQSEIEWIKQAQQQALLIQAVFGGIGFISLLVAAIGIANTMMMSVYERTKEIGVMKVMGAALGDIRKIFLFESATLGFFGGLVGVLLSVGGSALINAIFGSALGGEGGPQSISLIPPWLMLGALAFSTLIGTLAGLLPAVRASRLSPLAAIRSQ
ncbi:ABC transporter permease [Tessaracoccus defluvii]|uniref:ABC transporter permease n=1 Tax=Tessaracoccus defluvii TaxID=1285901 RepID=A0A7H0H990_9ACTN|nr:ABC transporter permease [Tessaracoccus defluvii]QNP57106.1 ABC transporter permease [Tessaracoccus defluvii]